MAVVVAVVVVVVSPSVPPVRIQVPPIPTVPGVLVALVLAQQGKLPVRQGKLTVLGMQALVVLGVLMVLRVMVVVGVTVTTVLPSRALVELVVQLSSTPHCPPMWAG
jgi:hypothetical protein